ncbi:uncharacterized protein BBA_08609 [Beauveria bassiana ARSEF 2860]|uniref:Uncharacterized protein n=1 Tax=Beauveria bassiana (strain ARSEF 2860) TaxID=655819 RepID=J4VVN9_BEAB2|nr:uncharacterized protein BBA_08609 [Beauveria bassiana ARSEF 2860]EJP62525.1 hypothetical protein BBA_08609 [Beauveria bassiana ARSEF 2860]
MPAIRSKKLRDEKRFNICQPNNPSIPFFPDKKEYKQQLLPPPDSAPHRNWPWLVEPGLLSIEIYEAIITQTLGRCSPLQKYICQTGVVQLGYAPRPGVIYGSRDHRVREDRDICFTMISIKEQVQIIRWMTRYGAFIYGNPKIATPYGYLILAGINDGSTRQNICNDLGFGISDSEYPRSILPPGVLALAAMDYYAWALLSEDGVPREGRATDDCGVQRIEWPTRYST